MAEGTIIVGAAVTTRDPEIIHFFERDAVAFQVIDSADADSVRGGYGGNIPGVVRPMLKWDTRYTLDERETVVAVSERHDL
jgi:lipopolysaccharide transport system ATP-binding protein